MENIIYALGFVCTFYIVMFLAFVIMAVRAPLDPNDD